MDVGNYISELLAQKGEVSVPGLGYFAHTRVNGYYNEREGKIYPPTYSVQFDPQLIDDDTLAQYIAEKKRISPASAKYFTEKYINNLKQQAQTEEAALADLGWFYVEQGRIFFSPNNDQSTDPNYFGYEPVNLNRLDGAPKVERTFAPIAQPTPEPEKEPYTEPETFAVAPDEYPDRSTGLRFETDEEHEAYLEEEARKRKRRGNWILTISILAIFALAVFLVYRYNPNVFNFNSPGGANLKAKDSVINAKVIAAEPAGQSKDTTAAKDTVQPVAQPDTQTAVPAKADSTTIKTTEPTAKNAVTVKDSIAGTRYEVLGGSFATTKKAEQAVANYKRKGIAAVIVNLPGSRMHRISLGTFKTHAEASAAQDKLLKDKKVKEGDTYVQIVK
ncbi:MAG: SPOR domain-containing protein [Mucilaginibacter sp.]|nr:SPOR domain-containing protein [Mucilaginibacter sp.]